MSLISAMFPPDPYSDENWGTEGNGGLVKQLSKVSQFLHGIHVQMRFGKLTRAPIQLLRFQIVGVGVECDWIARPNDTWDAYVPRSVRRRHASLQALRDAIDLRALLFDLMPQVESARFCTYRESPQGTRELIMTGCMQRNDHSARHLHSLVMRAKVLGFRFEMEGDWLREISPICQTLQNA
jgi:hypothetical protein